MRAHHAPHRGHPATRAVFAVAVLAAVVAAGCSDDGEGSDDTVDPSDLVTVVDAGPLEASMAEGEHLGIRFPSSSSIGDDWVLLESTDESIATIVDELTHVDDPEAEGSSGTVTFVVEGTAPGYSRLTFVNCFQGACSADDLPSDDLIDERDLTTVEVAVRVTGG